MTRFCNTASVPTIQNQHHFGCPTYVLKKELQDHKKIRKWSDRTRIGINLGYSSRHALSVSLILNLQTGLVSPQYHCQYNYLFETMMGTQARSIPTSQWQYKAGLTSDKPDTDGEDEPNEELWDNQSFEEYYSSQESEETSPPSEIRYICHKIRKEVKATSVFFRFLGEKISFQGKWAGYARTQQIIIRKILTTEM